VTIFWLGCLKTLDTEVAMHVIVVGALLLVATAPRYEVDLSLVGARDGVVLAAPKVCVLENQTARANIVSEHAGTAMQRILTTQTAIGENPPEGISWAVKVERLDDKRVLLHLDVQYNEVRKANQHDRQIVGNTLHAVKRVEVGKAVKFVLSSTRYVSATVKHAGELK
jgi:hypothetical protein